MILLLNYLKAIFTRSIKTINKKLLHIKNYTLSKPGTSIYSFSNSLRIKFLKHQSIQNMDF